MPIIGHENLYDTASSAARRCQEGRSRLNGVMPLRLPGGTDKAQQGAGVTHACRACKPGSNVVGCDGRCRYASGIQHAEIASPGVESPSAHAGYRISEASACTQRIGEVPRTLWAKTRSCRQGFRAARSLESTHLSAAAAVNAAVASAVCCG